MVTKNMRTQVSLLFVVASVVSLSACVPPGYDDASASATPVPNSAAPVTNVNPPPAAGAPAPVAIVVTPQSLEVTVIGAPSSIAQMKNGHKDNEFVLRLLPDTEAEIIAKYGSADALKNVVWTCTVDGVLVPTACGKGSPAHVSLTKLVKRGVRNQSSELKVKVEATIDTNKLASFERDLFLDAKLSKNESCFGVGDQEATIAAMVEGFAAAGGTALASTAPVFDSSSWKSSGPLFNGNLGATHAAGLRTIRDARLSADKKYLVAFRLYGRSDTLAADCGRGIILSRGVSAQAIVIDSAGHYAALTHTSGNYVVTASNLNSGAENESAGILTKNFPLEVGTINGAGTSMAAYLAGSVGTHWINYDPATVTTILGH